MTSKRTMRRAYFTHIDTPFGGMLLAGEGKQLVAIKFGVNERKLASAAADLSRELHGGYELVRDDSKVRGLARQVVSYLQGRRTSFDVELDLSHVTPFQRDVLMACAAIPRGEVRTYADLARGVGRPAAFRAVGQTMARNPIPIVIPCHRVVGSSGGLHGFGGGLDMKRRLLALEGAALDV